MSQTQIAFNRRLNTVTLPTLWVSDANAIFKLCNAFHIREYKEAAVETDFSGEHYVVANPADRESHVKAIAWKIIGYGEKCKIYNGRLWIDDLRDDGSSTPNELIKAIFEYAHSYDDWAEMQETKRLTVREAAEISKLAMRHLSKSEYPIELAQMRQRCGETSWDWGKIMKSLEQEFALELHRRESVADNEVSATPGVDNPDIFGKDTEITQKALHTLYSDKPWICVSDKLYGWTGNHYKHSDDAIELKRIRDFCNAYPVEQKNGSIAYPYATPAAVIRVLQWIKLSCLIDPKLVNPAGINCTNGVLKISWVLSKPSWKLIPHTPDLYYTYEPIATYNPEADPKDCDRLLTVLDAPQREIFLRTIAASLDLSHVRKYKGRLVRGLLLKGDGNNGKDSLREVVAAMYGYKGMTGCTLSDFSSYDNGRKFPLSRLKNSRINWATENANTSALDKLQSIKAFLTGDTLSSEGKGKDEVDYNATAVGLFNINDTPNMRGILEAITSRWGALSFIYTFKIGADPSKGEIEADPRFKYDPDFMRNQVLPAFLNRVLQALSDLMEHGIDYSCTQKALEDIQRENSHLFQFCQDVGLSEDPNSTVLASEIWARLEQWYQDNGTLEYEETSNGKRKAIWHDQSRKSDLNVKAINQVIARMSTMFPKAKIVAVAREGGGKPRMALQGIGLKEVVTQFHPVFHPVVTQAEPNKPLQDLGFNPVNPISSSPEKEKNLVNSSKGDSPKGENLTIENSTSNSLSNSTPPSLGYLGENPDVASNSGLKTGLKLGDESQELGDEPQKPPVGAWVRVHSQVARVIKHHPEVKNRVILDGQPAGTLVYGVYSASECSVLTKLEILALGLTSN